ncbi:MAG: hypothetical protein ACE5GF_06130 [Thermodesulfobacteriota bacterium]
MTIGVMLISLLMSLGCIGFEAVKRGVVEKRGKRMEHSAKLDETLITVTDSWKERGARELVIPSSG